MTVNSLLFCDLETRSEIDIRASGHHAYAEHPSTAVLLLGYAFDAEPPVLWQPHLGPLPAAVRQALADPAITKVAHNAAFELAVLHHVLGIESPIEAWRCTAVMGRLNGLPGGLAELGRALGLGAGQAKLASGTRLIHKFSRPQARAPRWRTWETDPEDWRALGEYCLRDVEAARAIYDTLAPWMPPEAEWALWRLDQRINERGLPVDRALVDAAIRIDADYRARALERAVALTGLTNPNSRDQLLEWLNREGEAGLADLRAASVREAIGQCDDASVREVLQIRQALAKTSVRKYQALARATSADGRLRGAFLFAGASRTARWCMPGEAEVLTPGGWVRMDAYAGEPILQWAKDGTFSWCAAPVMSRFPFAGTLIEIEANYFYGRFTPEHRIPVTSAGADTLAGALLGRPGFSPVLSGRLGGHFWPDAWTRLVVMVQADGSYCNQRIRLGFRKPRKIERALELLAALGIDWQYQTEATSKTVRISFAVGALPAPLRALDLKRFGPWVLACNPAVFIEEAALWDGSRSSNTTYEYTSTVKPNAEWVQTLAHLAGRSARLLPVTGHRPAHWTPAWRVNVRLSASTVCSFAPTDTRQQAYIREVDHDGPVYCPTTASGYFLVRHGGRIHVTGNSGQVFQPQNLPRGSVKDLETAVSAVQSADAEWVEALYGDVPAVLSACVRPAICAPEGQVLIAADYSSIESVVVAWLAESRYLLALFEAGRDPYKDFATRIFHVEYDAVTKLQRAVSKPATLGAAFGLGGPGLQRYAASMGVTLSEAEARTHIATYREAYADVPALWRRLSAGAELALRTRGTAAVGRLAWEYEKPFLFLRLPSGRRLGYYRPKLEARDTPWGERRITLTYEGQAQTTRKWGRIPTHAGKVVENCLAADTEVLTDRGWVPIVAVRATDRLWDGEAWVAHAGVLCQGEQDTIERLGIRATPDHRVLTPDGWVPFAAVERIEELSEVFTRRTFLPAGAVSEGFTRATFVPAKAVSDGFTGGAFLPAEARDSVGEAA